MKNQNSQYTIFFVGGSFCNFKTLNEAKENSIKGNFIRNNTTGICLPFKPWLTELNFKNETKIMDNKFGFLDKVLFTFRGKKYEAKIIELSYIFQSKKYEYTLMVNFNGTLEKVCNVKEEKIEKNDK